LQLLQLLQLRIAAAAAAAAAVVIISTVVAIIITVIVVIKAKGITVSKRKSPAFEPKIA